MNLWKEHAKQRHSIGRAAMAVFLAICFAWAAPASAKDVKPWNFTFAPYAWLTEIDGDVTAKGQKVDVDMSFGDIWDDLDFGGMLYLEMNNDRWGVFANTVYAKISPDETTPFGKVDVETESWIVDFGFLFRVMGFREEGETLDLILGGRYWDQQNELDLNFPDVGIVGTIEDSKDWIDPIIGLRYTGWFTENFGFIARGDVGGFDISDDSSDLTWSAQGVFGYRVGDAFNLWAGYRALGVDYDEGSGLSRFEFNATLHGPLVGIGFVF